jgi:hypothetical protein
MAIADAPGSRLSSWLLARKLYGRTTAEVAAALSANAALRVVAAACAFGSMVFVAWIGAFTRAVFRHGWAGSRTLGGAALANASAQAIRVQEDLIPVLAVWAALLLLTPTAYTIAFRAVTAAAGALGALDFSPPSFAVTPRVGGLGRELARVTHAWNPAWLWIAAVVAAYLLLRAALNVFNRLDEFSARRTVRPGRAVCFCLAFIVAASAAWSGSVVWLAAPAHGAAEYAAGPYGLRGALVVSDYLIALVVIAVLVAASDSPQWWLLAVAPLAAALGAVANVSPFPHDLVYAVERAGLERIGGDIGGAAWWTALFVGFPVCLIGLYLMEPTRR